MSVEPVGSCPACGSQDSQRRENGALGTISVVCHRCGDFELTLDALNALSSGFAGSITDKAKISFALRSSQESAGDQCPLLDSDRLMAILAYTKLPRPRDQQDNFVRWLGTQSQGRIAPDRRVRFLTAAGVMGAATDDDARRLLDNLEHQRLLLRNESSTPIGADRALSLSMTGWDRFYELEDFRPNTTQAFMAMQYGSPNIAAAHQRCFRPAAKMAGFELEPVWALIREGLLDEHILVGIRKCRFMVADLTGLNDNVLWEAGFATGLGRPVFYTCSTRFRKSLEKNRASGNKAKRSIKMPFDIEHRNTVFWKAPDDESALAQLRDMIRNTLPSEATMEDPPPQSP